jgi:hypothetical protein
MELEFSRQILKNTQVPNFMKVGTVGAELFHADGRTEIHNKANSRFSKFCEGA